MLKCVILKNAFAYYNNSHNNHHYNHHHHHNSTMNTNMNHHHHSQHQNYAAAIQQVYSVAAAAAAAAYSNYDSNSSSGISTSSALSSTSHTPIRGPLASSTAVSSTRGDRNSGSGGGIDSPPPIECTIDDSAYVVSSGATPITANESQADDISAVLLPVKKSKDEQLQASLDPAIISISKSADSIPSSPTIIKSSTYSSDTSKTTMPEKIANIITLSTSNNQDTAQTNSKNLLFRTLVY